MYAYREETLSLLENRGGPIILSAMNYLLTASWLHTGIFSEVS